MKKGLILTLLIVGIFVISLNTVFALDNSTNITDTNSTTNSTNVTDTNSTDPTNSTNVSDGGTGGSGGIIIPCVPQFVNTSWGEWKNISGRCRIEDRIINFARNLTQYNNSTCGSAINKTIFQYNETPCNYCTEEIMPYFSEWSVCSLNGTKERTKYFVDDNYYFCCKITGLSSDCSLRNYSNFENVTETIECGAFNLTINVPNKFIYNTMKVNLDVLSDNKLSRMEIKDYAEKNSKWNILCKECFSYNKTKTFSDGFHNISVRGFLKDGRSLSVEKAFIVDTKDPVIITPRIRTRGFTNGYFLINYTEINLDEITLFYGNKNITKNSSDCLAGKDQQCSFYQDLTNDSGEEILYYFIIKDKAGNIQKSKIERAIVDVIAPKLVNFSYNIILNDVYFHVGIDELNFKDVSYLDSFDKSGKWKVLCSRLKDGMCDKKQSFKPGIHNLTIMINDKAGNSFMWVI